MATRPVQRGLGLVAVVVCLTGVLAVVAANDGALPAAGARVTVDGRATVVHLDGSSEVLSSGDVVRAGEEVRADAGTFVLELAEGGSLEGRAGLGDAPDTRVVVGSRPELVAGELLVLGDDGLDVDAAGTIVTVAAEGGAARVDRGLSVRAGAYRGALEIDSGGQERMVPALRQLGIASLGRPPRLAEPFLVDAGDPWDRRFLGAAIDLSRRLDAFSSAFTSATPPDAATASLFEQLLPALASEPTFRTRLGEADTTLPGELLVGVAIVVVARTGSFDDRWDEVFGFRGMGAPWGLVALDQRLGTSEVLDVVADAVNRGDPAELAVAPPDGAVATPATTAPRTPTTAPGPTTTPTTEPPAPPPTVTPTTAPVPTAPPPPTLPTPIVPPGDEEPPDEGDGGLIGGILDGLLGDLLGG